MEARLGAALPRWGGAVRDPADGVTWAAIRPELATEGPLPGPCEGGERFDRAAEAWFMAPTTRPMVALTFDDGPSRENTPRILDVLAEYDVRATFFVLGQRGARMQDLLARIDAAGHDIGNHSWSHPSFRSLWHSQIHAEICQTHTLLRNALGKQPTLFRPPFGRYAPSAVPIVGALGYDLVLWSVDSLDWGEEDPAIIADTVVRQAQPGAIILLHDRRAVTVHALPRIIRGLRERGFAIEPVSALLGRDPYVSEEPALGVRIPPRRERTQLR